MANIDYDKKMAEMRDYIPFLETLIAKMKNEGDKRLESQINKMQMLHELITSENKKLKPESLQKCEAALKNICQKFANAGKSKALPTDRVGDRFLHNQNDISLATKTSVVASKTERTGGEPKGENTKSSPELFRRRSPNRVHSEEYYDELRRKYEKAPPKESSSQGEPPVPDYQLQSPVKVNQNVPMSLSAKVTPNLSMRPSAEAKPYLPMSSSGELSPNLPMVSSASKGSASPTLDGLKYVLNDPNFQRIYASLAVSMSGNAPISPLETVSEVNHYEKFTVEQKCDQPIPSILRVTSSMGNVAKDPRILTRMDPRLALKIDKSETMKAPADHLTELSPREAPCGEPKPAIAQFTVEQFYDHGLHNQCTWTTNQQSSPLELQLDQKAPDHGNSPAYNSDQFTRSCQLSMSIIQPIMQVKVNPFLGSPVLYGAVGNLMETPKPLLEHIQLGTKARKKKRKEKRRRERKKRLLEDLKVQHQKEPRCKLLKSEKPAKPAKPEKPQPPRISLAQILASRGTTAKAQGVSTQKSNAIELKKGQSENEPNCGPQDVTVDPKAVPTQAAGVPAQKDNAAELTIDHPRSEANRHSPSDAAVKPGSVPAQTPPSLLDVMYRSTNYEKGTSSSTTKFKIPKIQKKTDQNSKGTKENLSTPIETKETKGMKPDLGTTSGSKANMKQINSSMSNKSTDKKSCGVPDNSGGGRDVNLEVNKPKVGDTKDQNKHRKIASQQSGVESISNIKANTIEEKTIDNIEKPAQEKSSVADKQNLISTAKTVEEPEGEHLKDTPSIIVNKEETETLKRTEKEIISKTKKNKKRKAESPVETVPNKALKIDPTNESLVSKENPETVSREPVNQESDDSSNLAETVLAEKHTKNKENRKKSDKPDKAGSSSSHPRENEDLNKDLTISDRTLTANSKSTSTVSTEQTPKAGKSSSSEFTAGSSEVCPNPVESKVVDSTKSSETDVKNARSIADAAKAQSSEQKQTSEDQQKQAPPPEQTSVLDTSSSNQQGEKVTKEWLESFVLNLFAPAKVDSSSVLIMLEKALDPEKFQKIKKILCSENSGSSSKEDQSNTKKRDDADAKKQVTTGVEKSVASGSRKQTASEAKKKVGVEEQVAAGAKKQVTTGVEKNVASGSKKQAATEAKKKVGVEEQIAAGAKKLVTTGVEKNVASGSKKQAEAKKAKVHTSTEKQTPAGAKKQATTTDPKNVSKKRKNELDMLNDDIQEMFIRDGVLAACGRRHAPLPKKKKNELDKLNEDIDDMFIRDGVLAASGLRSSSVNTKGKETSDPQRSSADSTSDPVEPANIMPKESVPQAPKIKTMKIKRRRESVLWHGNKRQNAISAFLERIQSDEWQIYSDTDEDGAKNQAKNSRLADKCSEKAKSNESTQGSKEPLQQSRRNSQDDTEPSQQKAQSCEEGERIEDGEELLKIVVGHGIVGEQVEESSDLSPATSAKGLPDKNVVSVRPTTSSEPLQPVIVEHLNTTNADSAKGGDTDDVRTSIANQTDYHDIIKPCVVRLEHCDEYLSEANLLRRSTQNELRNINPNIHAQSESRLKCALCNFTGIQICLHYVTSHPGSEVFVSRLSPQCKDQLLAKEQPLPKKIRKKNSANTFYSHTCPICVKQLSLRRYDWVNHFANHTGEFRYKCSKCRYVTNTKFSIERHIDVQCPAGHMVELQSQIGFAIPVYGYVCKMCNYIQMDNQKVIGHLHSQHDCFEEDMVAEVVLLDCINAVEAGPSTASVSSAPAEATAKETLRGEEVEKLTLETNSGGIQDKSREVDSLDDGKAQLPSEFAKCGPNDPLEAALLELTSESDSSNSVGPSVPKLSPQSKINLSTRVDRIALDASDDAENVAKETPMSNSLQIEENDDDLIVISDDEEEKINTTGNESKIIKNAVDCKQRLKEAIKTIEKGGAHTAGSTDDDDDWIDIEISSTIGESESITCMDSEPRTPAQTETKSTLETPKIVASDLKNDNADLSKLGGNGVQRVDNIGFKQNSVNGVTYSCLIKGCSFLYSSILAGLQYHLESEHKQIQWSGFCHICNTHVMERKNIGTAEELRHMQDAHIDKLDDPVVIFSILTDSKFDPPEEEECKSQIEYMPPPPTTPPSIITTSSSTEKESEEEEHKPKLRFRRLSGDLLSGAAQLSNENSSPLPFQITRVISLNRAADICEISIQQSDRSKEVPSLPVVSSNVSVDPKLSHIQSSVVTTPTALEGQDVKYFGDSTAVPSPGINIAGTSNTGEPSFLVPLDIPSSSLNPNIVQSEKYIGTLKSTSVSHTATSVTGMNAVGMSNIGKTTQNILESSLKPSSNSTSVQSAGCIGKLKIANVGNVEISFGDMNAPGKSNAGKPKPLMLQNILESSSLKPSSFSSVASAKNIGISKTASANNAVISFASTHVTETSNTTKTASLAPQNILDPSLKPSSNLSSARTLKTANVSNPGTSFFSRKVAGTSITMQPASLVPKNTLGSSLKPSSTSSVESQRCIGTLKSPNANNTVISFAGKNVTTTSLMSPSSLDASLKSSSSSGSVNSGRCIETLKEMNVKTITDNTSKSCVGENVAGTSNTKKKASFVLKSLKPWARFSSIKPVRCMDVQLQDKSLCALYKCLGINCDYVANHHSDFVRHLEGHPQRVNEKWRECCYCDAVMLDAVGLMRHITTEHANDIYQCAYCFYRSCSDHNVVEHQKLYHYQKEIKVFLLPGLKLNKINALRLATENVKKYVAAIRCQDCPKEFLSISEFLSHLSVHAVGNKTVYNCFYCKSSENKVSISSAANHLAVRHGIFQFHCVYCTFASKDRNTLQRHMVDSHPSKFPFCYLRMGKSEVLIAGDIRYKIDLEKRIVDMSKVVDEKYIHWCPFSQAELNSLGVQKK